MRCLILAMTFAVILVSSNTEAAMLKKVTFESQGQTLVGTLYLPDNYQEGQQLPGAVVTGAWTTVKEQMAGTYARELADRGFATLAFDFRGWGESPDAVMYLEDPRRKTEDILAAVQFLQTRPEVDGSKVGGLGICASAGYMSDAAAENPDISVLALVAPWLHNASIVETVYGGRDSVAGLVARGREAAASDEPVIIEAASATNEKSLMYQVPYYTEPHRGLIPEYDNKFNVASWEGWLTYDALQTAERQDTPTLLVHSKAAAIPQGAENYAELMDHGVTLIWLEKVTQFEFYDRQDVVKAAADAVAAYFKRQW